MALTKAQSSFAIYVKNKAAYIVKTEKPDLELIIAQWFQEGHSAIDSAELFEATGITLVELTDAITSLIAIQNAIGDFQTGAAVGLSKIASL